MSKLQSFLSSKYQDDITIEWKNINYGILVKDVKISKPFRPVYVNRKIVNNVSGKAKSGELLAIMGPTGCGKTSLLNVLAARISATGSSIMKLSGDITVNGYARVDSQFRKMSAYVLQDDKMYPQLTVYETLMLAAHFYLPTSTTDDEKNTLVLDIITELGLIKTKDTIIGDGKVRGVSGGERKRVNIAVQVRIYHTLYTPHVPLTLHAMYTSIYTAHI